MSDPGISSEASQEEVVQEHKDEEALTEQQDVSEGTSEGTEKNEVIQGGPPVDPPQFQLVYGINDEGSDTTSITSPVSLDDDTSKTLPILSKEKSSLEVEDVNPSLLIPSTIEDSMDSPEAPNSSTEKMMVKNEEVSVEDSLPSQASLDLKVNSESSVDTPPVSPSVLSLPPELFNKTQTQEGIFFSGIYYLGSSTVDAPVSEVEANRKMQILKTQAGQPMAIILQIPPSNAGNIMLKDPSTNQILTAFAIRHVLFCARGDIGSDLNDCLALNVIHKRSGVYHCHVFQCQIPEACERVFFAIGKAFKQKESGIGGSSSQLCFELQVQVEIHEEDQKGNYHSVSIDKDCFRIRPHVKKKVIFIVSQSTTSSDKPLPLDRCFGLLMAVGKDVKRSDMHLLDNMNTTSSGNTDSTSFIVSGYWDTNLPFLSQLMEEPPKSTKVHFLTVAADLVADKIIEPLRFTRILKIKVGKPETLGSLKLLNLSTLTRRKAPVETFSLVLEKKPPAASAAGSDKSVQQFVVKSLKSLNQPLMLSPSAKDKIEVAKSPEEVSTPPTLIKKIKESDAQRDSDADDVDESDIVVSGWGDDEKDLRDDLLQRWSEMLERWDGKDKWEPFGEKQRSKHLCKLVRCGIPSPLRCQIWQMLSGADNDPQLLEAYRLLVTKESPNENVITWDIKRTFVGHEYFQDGVGGREALYKISKAYSIYDQEVGYCQGFSFMAAVLLLQKMPEEQAFSVLVKIMFNYGHRNVFKSNFKELHLMFFQLQRLVEEHLHELHEHFINKSIETHMYASQWFLTIYTAKFPLHVTYQIIDMYLCEGVPVVFQVALALLKITQTDLLNLDFEGILNYFRASLPKKFGSEEEAQHLFDVTKSYQNKVTLKKLKKLEKDHQAHLDHLAQLEDPSVRMERENKQLQETVLRLQRENDDLAEELVGSKVFLRAEMDKLEERIDTLSKECRAHKSSLNAANILIKELKEELEEAKATYQKALLQLTEERQQHEVAISEYKQLYQQLDEGHQKENEDLSQELLEVKAQLGAGSTNGGDHKTHLTSEQRLRQLELELAQTKLALVEAQCKNQELEHQNVNTGASSASQSRGKSWLSRFNNL